MKKILTVILVLVMAIGVMTSCSGGGQSDGNVDVELNNVGTSLALLGRFTNNGDSDVAAVITVNWYDETDNQIGYSVSEIPYIMQGDSAFDVFDFGELYDHYDYTVETKEPSEEVINFYNNLTIESEERNDGTIEYKVGGGNGEAFEADVVVQYFNQDDELVDYRIVTAKGEGTAAGTIEPSKVKGVVSYMMTMIPKGMMKSE